MNMLNVLHTIRQQAIDITGDASTFVRLEANREHSSELMLEVIASKHYFPFVLDKKDLEMDSDAIMEFVAQRMNDEYRGNG